MTLGWFMFLALPITVLTIAGLWFVALLFIQLYEAIRYVCLRVKGVN